MWYIILFAATLLLDQISKIVLDAVLGLDNPIVVIKGILNINIMYNDGASFGIFSGTTWGQPMFFVLTCVALLGGLLFVFIKRPKGKWLNSTLALMFSGTIGNFIDRVSFGYVRDFIDMTSFFANFNIADCCLCIGAAMLIIYVFFIDKDAIFKKKEKGEKKGKKAVESATSDDSSCAETLSVNCENTISEEDKKDRLSHNKDENG